MNTASDKTKSPLSFREVLEGPRFGYGAELVTTRGFSEEGERTPLVELAEALAGDPRIDWISVTDNAGGNPMMAPDWAAELLDAKQSELVIHLTCKDLNRNGLESVAWRYAADGFNNLLALTGDYPATGYGGNALPVFDLDSVSLIALLEAMNQGMQVKKPNGTIDTLRQTHFYTGCCVSPFKRQERELMPQYYKLARKIESGAHWVISQLGYDMRKFQEIQLFMDWSQIQAPVIGNVYLLNRFVAGLFNKKRIPGCVVSDTLMEKVEKYASGPDKGRAYFKELAAQQLAVFKGLGFAAGYLGGMHKADTFFEIIDRAESYGPNDWKEFAREIQFPQEEEFYLFDQDPDTGLGVPGQLNPAYVQSLAKPKKPSEVTLGYRMTRKIHSLAFTPDKNLFPRLQKMYEKLDNKSCKNTLKFLHKVEYGSKHIGFGCRDCGDCSLPDTAYLCPRASCAKQTRNGPCGGSTDGRCELDNRDCIWARAYDRMKYYGESKKMLKGPAVFYNANLQDTSAWANNFLEKDHHAPKKEEDGSA